MYDIYINRSCCKNINECGAYRELSTFLCGAHASRKSLLLKIWVLLFYRLISFNSPHSSTAIVKSVQLCFILIASLTIFSYLRVRNFALIRLYVRPLLFHSLAYINSKCFSTLYSKAVIHFQLTDDLLPDCVPVLCVTAEKYCLLFCNILCLGSVNYRYWDKYRVLHTNRTPKRKVLEGAL